MRHILLFFVSLLISFNQYINLKDFFPTIDLNDNQVYSTREINHYVELSSFDERYKAIPDSLSFTYLCDSDSSQFQYSYDLYHMEEGNLIGTFKQNYKFHAISLIEKENFDIFIYSKFHQVSYEIHLRTFSKEGATIGHLILNEHIIDSEPYYFKVASLKDQFINTFSYYSDQNYIVENSTKKTKVVIDNYRLNDNGSLSKEDSKIIYLDKKNFKYNNFDADPMLGDPFLTYSIND